MSLIELFIIAVGLSMDAFAAAICKGLSMKKISIKKSGIVGLYFGTFQAVMPLIGYLLGIQFQGKITSVDHWIAFILLGFIGINMIRESRKCKCEIAADSLSDRNADCILDADSEYDPLNYKNMTVLALATSIDALAVGVTFAFLKVNIASAASFIGIVTFLISMTGVMIGNIFGAKYQSKAEFTGGLILVLMGIKIVLEHTKIINI